MANTILAILFGSICYSMLNISMVLQKKGASELPTIQNTDAKNNIKNFAKNKTWLLGFILLNLKDIPFWIALNYGPLSLVTPMAGFGLIVLVIFSKYYLKEEIQKPMYIGVVVTIIGIVIIGATSDAAEIVYDWEENLAIISQPKSLIIVGIIMMMMFLPALFTKMMNYKHADILFALSAGFSISIGNLFSKIMSSGFSHLDQILFYVMFGLMLFGNTGGVIFTQYGFQKGKAIIVTPIYAVCGVVIPVMIGAFVFNEFVTYDPTRIILKIVGVLLTVIGVALISFFNTQKEERKVDVKSDSKI